MSLQRRDSPFANSARVVTVEPRDYLGTFGAGALAGIEMQRAIERRGFELGQGSFVAPAQRLTDFVAKRPSGDVLASSYRPRVIPGDVRAALPAFVADALDKALFRFQRTMPGFLGADAQLVGAEPPTTSPAPTLRYQRLASPSPPSLSP